MILSVLQLLSTGAMNTKALPKSFLVTCKGYFQGMFKEFWHVILAVIGIILYG